MFKWTASSCYSNQNSNFQKSFSIRPKELQNIAGNLEAEVRNFGLIELEDFQIQICVSA